MASEFVFHIRNAHPGDMAAVLATLDTHPSLETIAEIVRQAEALGFAIHDRQRLEALTTACDLGLVEKGRNVLTDEGRLLIWLEMDKPVLFVDIIHGLQYTLWNERLPSANCFSWSYRALCQMLWHTGAKTVNSRRELASEIETQARTAFGRPDIVFSPKSIGGALLWLTELEPSVLDQDDERFTRRPFCPPELFALGVDFVYQTQEIDYGVNLLLIDERRDAICQVCLLEPTSFDRVLEYAVAQFDYLEQGTGGGWGRYLTLRRAPRLEDFLT
ncbi:MAG: hypothetical protein H8E47_04550 [Anaerolineales bacterium]|nr:hypothetical protein [Anaerolineales bacterium]